MELLDKGKHCEEEFCHQLDFLPSKCKACSKLYCKNHIRYQDHNCKEANKFNYVIPTCPLCNKAIEFERGKDLDLCLAQHMLKCEEEEQQQLNNKLKNASLKDDNSKANKNRCKFSNCRSKDAIRFDCPGCHNSFCVKHRILEVHNCSILQKKSCSQQNGSIKQKDNYFTVNSY